MSEQLSLRGQTRDIPVDYSRLPKSEQTRKILLDTTLEFLWTNSFRDLTVAVLTAKAGVSRTCFYQYFSDRHSLMEVLLADFERELLVVAAPWIESETDSAKKLSEGLYGLVKLCYERGPIARAIYESAPTDERLEKAWNKFVDVFDSAIADRIKQDQEAGVAPHFEPRSVAIALNRMNIGVMIHHFGRHPRCEIQPVHEAITRIWLNTIYGK
jgi:AcrR family transcriptional regulator